MAGLPFNRFSRRPKRNKEPLPNAAAPESIPAARNVGLRTAGDDAAGAAGGLEWPVTEINRVTQVLRIYDPHDATRYVDIEQVTQLELEDIAGTVVTLNLTP